MTPDARAILRRSQENAAGDEDRRRAGGLEPVYPVVVGQVFAQAAVPTRSGVYVSVRPVEVAGAEHEAGLGVLTTDVSRMFRAYLVGSRPVNAGDYLICRFVGDRWVAERMGASSSGGVTIPGCPCSATPATLHLAMNHPDALVPVIQPCALRWGPTPTGLLPLLLGDNCYLSTTTFSDPFSGDQYWYHITCALGYYQLTRVYSSSIYGSPFRDVIRYRWLIGTPGNSCRPFLMARGIIYSSGDPTCVVTLSE